MKSLLRWAALAGLVALHSVEARAWECAAPKAASTPLDGATVPLTAHPWYFIHHCSDLTSATCLMTSGDDSIRVTLEIDDCAAIEGYSDYDAFVRLTPEETPLSGRTYSLDCDDLPGWLGANAITFADIDVVAPIDFEVLSVDQRRGDEPCGSAREIDVHIDLLGDTEPFFAQGGVIEVASMEAPLRVISRPEDGPWTFPASGHSIVLTAVAADGTRGVPRVVDRREFSGCSIGGESIGLWLVLPLLVGRRSARRRRRARRRETLDRSGAVIAPAP